MIDPEIHTIVTLGMLHSVLMSMNADHLKELIKLGDDPKLRIVRERACSMVDLSIDEFDKRNHFAKLALFFIEETKKLNIQKDTL